VVILIVDIFILVPDVLTSCAEFIEKFGIVDGIYRLSGVTSNIQRLRFVSILNTLFKILSSFLKQTYY